eukprot:6196830-Pleurochrysis_carterae.AAC.9
MAAALSLNKGAAVLSMGSAAGGSSAGRSSSGGGDLDVRSLRARRLRVRGSVVRISRAYHTLPLDNLPRRRSEKIAISSSSCILDGTLAH